MPRPVITRIRGAIDPKGHRSGTALRAFLDCASKCYPPDMNSWEIIAADPAAQFLDASRAQLAYWTDKIRHCFAQLGDEQVWWRPHSGNNALGNIILHLCGNMRQWLIDGIRGEANHRDRPAEFNDRTQHPKAQLMAMLGATVAEADGVLASLAPGLPASLMQPRRIQGFDINVMAAIHDAVPHVGMHAQEIVWITRMLLGEKYRFHWTPANREQGS